MRVVPGICAAAASACLLASAWAEGDGLTTNAERVPWPRIEARVLALGAPSWRSELAPYERTGLKTGGLGVMGDLYFDDGTARPAGGGFRATSGLIVGSRSSASPGTSFAQPFADRRFGSVSLYGAAQETVVDNASSTVPYLGVGYSNAWPKSGWRVSADLGLVSYSPGSATGIGRVLGGSQSLDDLVRDMRLAPVVQLGVSYSF